MIITLAYEKNSKSIYGNIIKLWTRSKYSHVEMIIKDKWVSSGSNAGEGVSIKDLKPLKTNYDYVKVDVDGRKLSTVMKFLDRVSNAEYDYLGVFFGGGFDINIDDNAKFYCSELIVHILQLFNAKASLILEAAITSPQDLSIVFPPKNIENFKDI